MLNQTKKNLYEILGITTLSSAEEIKSAYRKLARKYHPDVTGNDAESIKKFKEITEAYETLSDETKKKRYNILMGIYNYNNGSSGNEQATKTQAEKAYTKTKQEEKADKTSFSSILNDIMDGFKPQENSKKPMPKNGEDIYTELLITFEEALKGTSKIVNILTTQICPKCQGRKFINDLNCTICSGKGYQEVHKKLNVKVPQNVKNKSKIRIANEGHSGLNGGKNGDLYLNVIIESNINFKYEELNILCTIPITPAEAVLGTTINIPVANGNVSMKVMPNTNSGQKYRLSGEGLKKGNKTGDIIVTVNIEIPKNLSEKEKDLYKQLQDIAKQKVATNG